VVAVSFTFCVPVGDYEFVIPVGVCEFIVPSGDVSICS
jgi:hypothetical protein